MKQNCKGLAVRKIRLFFFIKFSHLDVIDILTHHGVSLFTVQLFVPQFSSKCDVIKRSAMHSAYLYVQSQREVTKIQRGLMPNEEN
jgi:hypothetical protein